MQHREHIFLYFTIFVLSFYGATAQTFSFGGCKDLQGVESLDYEQFQGIWYEYGRTPWLPEEKSRCNTFVIGTPEDGAKTIKSLKIQTFLFWEYQEGQEQKSSIDGSKGRTQSNYEYTYLDVVYDSYAIAYTCQDLLLAKQDVIWILTRSRFPSEDIIQQIYKKIPEFGLSTEHIKQTDQTNCPDTWDENSNLLDAIINIRG